jgi:hypothetical protein
MEDDALVLREAGLALLARIAKRKKAEEDDDEPLLICIASAAVAVAAVVLGEDDNNEHHIEQGSYNKKRARRRLFDVWGAWGNIQRDYLGERALFDGEFWRSFRLSRSRVESIIQDLGASGDTFFETFRSDKFGRVGPSLEAKVLLPLISIAYGDPPHALFCAYFQMSTPSMARECYRHFLLAAIVVTIYGDEYLRIPSTANDLRSITMLHKHVHRGVEGMIGSLDCMLQTKWKDCPVAWQQSFKEGIKVLVTLCWRRQQLTISLVLACFIWLLLLGPSMMSID